MSKSSIYVQCIVLSLSWLSFQSISLAAGLRPSSNSRLLPDTYDFRCEVQDSSDVIVEDYAHDIIATTREIIATTMEFNDVLSQTIGDFERHHIHCEQVREQLQNLSISKFVRISPNHHYIQNNVTRIYIELAELSYLSNILNSAGAEMCCFSFPRLFTKLTNMILRNWYILHLARGDHLTSADCSMTGHIRGGRNALSNCNDKRDLVYTVLRHGLHKLKESVAVARSELKELEREENSLSN